MTAWKNLTGAVVLCAALISLPVHAAQTVMDTQISINAAAAWVQAYAAVLDSSQSTDKKKVYNVMRPDMKGSQIILDQFIEGSVHFRLIKN